MGLMPRARNSVMFLARRARLLLSFGGGQACPVRLTFFRLRSVARRGLGSGSVWPELPLHLRQVLLAEAPELNVELVSSPLRRIGGGHTEG